jgi:hypothetical protein
MNTWIVRLEITAAQFEFKPMLLIFISMYYVVVDLHPTTFESIPSPYKIHHLIMLLIFISMYYVVVIENFMFYAPILVSDMFTSYPIMQIWFKL